MMNAAENVQDLIIPGRGHWVMEQVPDAMLTAFLAPCRAE